MNKATLRSHYKKILEKIGEVRRQEAKEHLLVYLAPYLEKFHNIVSFMSLTHEIDLRPLNEYLLAKGKLLLPKLAEDHLEVYKIKDLTKDLQKGKKSLLEPIPEFCKKTETFDCILVPALAFDESKNRLGYGLGCYDKLLAKNFLVYTIGIGFREQLSHELLPKEDHDQVLSELCLI